jgi:hypothetical protein
VKHTIEVAGRVYESTKIIKERFGVGDTTLWRWAKRGLLPSPVKLGLRSRNAGESGALQALLFHTAFWHTKLAYFDRCPMESWPQSQVGVVLWSLSVSANDWLDRETLTRLCTVPVIGVLESTWDLGSFAMEARILRLLVWFGLMEYRLDESTGDIEWHMYRKTRLFDRFVRFNVLTEIPPRVRH